MNLADEAEVVLHLARVKHQVLEVLRADGVAARIGNDHIHGNTHEAVEAALADMDAGTDG